MANIASGESDLTRSLDTHGQDEVTQLSQHFNTFTAKLRQVVSQLQVCANALGQSSAELGLEPATDLRARGTAHHGVHAQ